MLLEALIALSPYQTKIGQIYPALCLMSLEWLQIIFLTRLYQSSPQVQSLSPRTCGWRCWWRGGAVLAEGSPPGSVWGGPHSVPPVSGWFSGAPARTVASQLNLYPKKSLLHLTRLTFMKCLLQYEKNFTLPTSWILQRSENLKVYRETDGP